MTNESRVRKRVEMKNNKKEYIYFSRKPTMRHTLCPSPPLCLSCLLLRFRFSIFIIIDSLSLNMRWLQYTMLNTHSHTVKNFISFRNYTQFSSVSTRHLFENRISTILYTWKQRMCLHSFHRLQNYRLVSSGGIHLCVSVKFVNFGLILNSFHFVGFKLVWGEAKRTRN